VKLDLIFWGLVFIFGLLGFFSGFWMQVIRLGALAGAYLLAGFFGQPLGKLVGGALGVPSLIGQILGAGLAFLLLYAILSSIGWSVLRWYRRKKDKELTESGEEKPARRGWDRPAGALLGAAKTFLVLYVLLCAVVLVEKPLNRALGSSKRLMAKSAMADMAREHNILSGLHLPAVGNVAALGKVAKDPRFREKVMRDPKVRRLLEHPKIEALTRDRALQSAAQRNDIAAIMANPRLNAVLDDPQVQKLLEDIDLGSIE